MSFSNAIRDACSKYATFSGRSSRAAYWWFYLFAIIAIVGALVVDAALGTAPAAYLVVLAGLFLPNLAVTARRLHDAGHSAWWMLISIVPLVGFVVMLWFTLQRSDGPNAWGGGPDGRGPEVPVPA